MGVMQTAQPHALALFRQHGGSIRMAEVLRLGVSRRALQRAATGCNAPRSGPSASGRGTTGFGERQEAT
jgi:hypothetical protein